MSSKRTSASVNNRMEELSLINSDNIELWTHLRPITVFLSRFGTFLRSELKFSKLPVQSSHHQSKKQILISLNKLQMLWFIHANVYVQLAALS